MLMIPTTRTLNDRRINVDIDGGVQTINFDQRGGLDLHRFGHFSSRVAGSPLSL